MSSPVICRALVTFIWVETTLELLKEGKSSSPFAFLASDASYVPRFEQLRAWVAESLPEPNPDPDGLMLPWDKVAGQLFWTRYLNAYPKGQGSRGGGDAWKAMVPFRHKLNAAVKAEWLPATALVEGFYYPHGHAAMITFTVRPPEPLTLDAMIDLCRDIRKRRKLSYLSTDGTPMSNVLDALGSDVLTVLRERALGTGTPAGQGASSPFSLVTLVEVEDADPDAPVVQGDDVHRLLEAVTGWREPLGKLPALAGRMVGGPEPDMVNILYAGRRGRAVWSPDSAIKPSESDEESGSDEERVPRHTLGCYHRNLAFASLQVESLASLAVSTNAVGFQGDIHRDVARFAGGILGRMYGGSTDVYRTRSCQRQLEDNNWLDEVDKLRTQFPSMKALVRKNPPPAAAPAVKPAAAP